MSRVTVVINVYNEAERLPVLLECLEAQTLPDFDVLFVDDGSTDETVKLLREYRGPLKPEIIALEHRGLAPARMHGLKQVGTGIAVVVDADMTFQPAWLEAIDREFQDHRVGGLFSRVKYYPVTFMERGAVAVREVLFWLRNRSPRPWMVGHGMALRAEALHGLSFDAHPLFAEDLELSEALTDEGWKIVALLEPPITTEDPKTPAVVWRRHRLVGRRTWYLVLRHPRFLTRLGNVGRFFPLVLAALAWQDWRWALIAELGLTVVLVILMRSRGVAFRDLVPGWVVFHLQTVSASLGFVEEIVRAVARRLQLLALTFQKRIVRERRRR